LFKDRDSEIGHPAAPAGAAALTRWQILGDPRPASPRDLASFAQRYEQWRQRASIALGQIDLTPDLANEIGSRRWLRGLGTMIGLTALAFAGWPDFAPLRAAPAMRLADRARY
jgi:hypothetical protein